MKTTNSKERGLFLTILIIWGIIGALLIFFSGIIYPLVGMGSDNVTLLLLISMLEFVSLAVALSGMWNWKKWGVYSLVAYTITSILATVLFAVKLYGGYAIGGIVIDLLGAGLWFWALSRKWSYFN